MTILRSWIVLATACFAGLALLDAFLSGRWSWGVETWCSLILVTWAQATVLGLARDRWAWRGLPRLWHRRRAAVLLLVAELASLAIVVMQPRFWMPGTSLLRLSVAAYAALKLIALARSLPPVASAVVAISGLATLALSGHRDASLPATLGALVLIATISSTTGDEVDRLVASLATVVLAPAVLVGAGALATAGARAPITGPLGLVLVIPACSLVALIARRRSRGQCLAGRSSRETGS